MTPAPHPSRRAVLAVAAIGLSTALTATLSGCSAASGGTSGGITLTFSWWGNDDRAARTEKAVRLFEKEHPGVSVRTSNGEFGAYLQKLATQAAGAALPGAAVMAPVLALLVLGATVVALRATALRAPHPLSAREALLRSAADPRGSLLLAGAVFLGALLAWSIPLLVPLLPGPLAFAATVVDLRSDALES
ncbi:extracellular solute-binding protein [Streptomyces rhizosphaericus]|uniref:extracellular solute-binding protein n=1 Tax=Streptomyces rhizosphaericus TaxID=114699 RepID=UPI0019D24D49|nr:extracellular solute-binding protein [Streptomyces rhizosphaericus]